jgi:hypothetical protein
MAYGLAVALGSVYLCSKRLLVIGIWGLCRNTHSSGIATNAAITNATTTITITNPHLFTLATRKFSFFFVAASTSTATSTAWSLCICERVPVHH